MKKLVQQVTDAVDDHAGGDPTRNRRLAQLEISVEDKLATLKNLDSEILDGLTENTDVSEDAIAEEVEQADAIKELAYGAIVAIDEIYKPGATVSLPSPSTVHTVDVKLPKLEIHPFDGNVTKWITFWDSFESAVDSNTRLSDIDKFNYLRSLLEKSAADAIAGLTLTAANYKEAVAILKKRFGNEQRIIDKHLETLMHLDAVTSQSNVQGLRKLYDLVESQVCFTLNDGRTRQFTLYAVPNICEPLTCQPIAFCQENFEHLSGLSLADTTDECDRLEIDILLGSDYYWTLLTGEVRRGPSGPVGVQTELGWVLSGPVGTPTQEHNKTTLFTHTLHVENLARTTELRFSTS